MHDYLRPLGEVRPLRDPVLIASFSGWNDFGGAASATLRYLSRQWNARPLVEIDPEPFFDFTVQRPTVHLAADERVIRWPRNRFEVASPEGAERDFLLLRGTEPHLKWRTFLELITEVMDATGATTSITLAAQPAAVPHTRPLPVSLSASDSDFEEQFGLQIPESRYEGPTGIVGVLNLAQRDLGRRNASLWAQAPHYLTTGPNPKVMMALVRVIDRGFKVSTAMEGLEARDLRFQREVEQAMSESGEAASYIEALEEQYDSNVPSSMVVDEGSGVSGGELPTSEELLSDLEQFLKRQRDSED